MKVLILSISTLALLISGIWVYKSGFSYEPMIVFLLGITGILNYFLNPKGGKKETTKHKNSHNVESSSEQNVELVVNLDSKSTQIKNEDIQKQERLEKEAKINSMKSKFGILFIDDDEKFNVVKILKNSGWRNTKSVVDIKSLDEDFVIESDVLFVDINGVGKHLNCKYEGLDLALMLKQKFPHKKVGIYSANKKFNSFHDAWDKCDFKLEKSALPYQFQSLVENYSIEFYS